MSSIILNIWRKELLSFSRARGAFSWRIFRTFLGGVILSIIAYAVIFAVKDTKRAVLKVPTEGLQGSALGERLAASLKDAGFVLTPFQGDLRSEVAAGRVAAGLRLAESGTEADAASRPVQLFVNKSVGGELTQRRGAERLKVAIEDFNERELTSRLQAPGVPAEPGVQLKSQDLGTEQQRIGRLLALIATFLVASLAGGNLSGSTTALKIGANEREHQALEALLTTPSSNAEILAGKLLGMLTLSLAGAVLVMAGYWSSTAFMGGVLGLHVENLRLSAAVLTGLVPVALGLVLVLNVLYVAVALCFGDHKHVKMATGIADLAFFAVMVIAYNLPPQDSAWYLVPFYAIPAVAQALAAGTPVGAVRAALSVIGVLGSATLFFVAGARLFDREKAVYSR